MANQHSGKYQPVASWAALDERVLGLENDVQKIDQKLDSGLNSLRVDFNTAIASIVSKLDAQGKPNWNVIVAGIGVGITILVTLGTLAYLPIKSDTDSLKSESLRRYEQTRNESRTNYDQLVTRDQRIWDHVLRMQSQIDRMDGRNSANR